MTRHSVYRNASTAFLGVYRNASTAFLAARPVLLAVSLLAGGATAAFAQTDFSGTWAPIFHEDQIERIPGPDVGDYAGLPINDARAAERADTWDASLLTLPEHQCKPHPSTYGFRGVGNLRITAGFNEANAAADQDLHPHPVAGAARAKSGWTAARIRLSSRPHTWQGFSTGRFEGNVLVVRTTHLKAGMDPPQRAGAQRRSDHDGALHPPRQLPDARLHDRRPALPDRAARSRPTGSC